MVDWQLRLVVEDVAVGDLVVRDGRTGAWADSKRRLLLGLRPNTSVPAPVGAADAVGGGALPDTVRAPEVRSRRSEPNPTTRK